MLRYDDSPFSMHSSAESSKGDSLTIKYQSVSTPSDKRPFSLAVDRHIMKRKVETLTWALARGLEASDANYGCCLYAGWPLTSLYATTYGIQTDPAAKRVLGICDATSSTTVSRGAARGILSAVIRLPYKATSSSVSEPLELDYSACCHPDHPCVPRSSRCLDL